MKLLSKNMQVSLTANTSQFKSAMADSARQMKLINSEFKSNAAETDKYGNSLDKTGAKQKRYGALIEQYKLRISAIKNEQKHWTAELKKGNITQKQHAEKQKELSTRLNNTEASLKKTQGALRRLNSEGKTTKRTYADVNEQFKRVGTTMRNVGLQVGVSAGVGFMAMKRVLTDIVKEAAELESGLAEVQAISGATATEMEVLSKQTKDLGGSTIFTAQQVAEAQAGLARAGFEVNEITAAMPGLLDLAASSNMELAQASSITSNILRGFGLEAEKAGRVADVLAKGAATANTDVAGLGQAMEVVAPVAKTLGVNFEDLAASTGIMADSGIDGSKAGRMLRQGMLRLAKPTGDAAKTLEKLKIEVFDANGNMKSMDKVVAELEKGLKGQTKQQQAATLATIFGSESVAGWSALLQKGSGSLKDYIVELENSDGAAKDMADTMQDTAQGSIVRMQSALSGLKIELGEKLLPILGRSADVVADLANRFSEMDDATAQTVAETALFVTALLGVTMVVGTVVAAIGGFIALAGLTGAIIAGGVVAVAGLTMALKLNANKTKQLGQEQKEATKDARRYGEGLSDGTKEAVKGYTDLYEGAKVKMMQLKQMSGDEAQATSSEIVKAFSEMTDKVIETLEAQKQGLVDAINDVLGVAGDTGVKAAGEMSKRVIDEIDEDIGAYVGAMEVVKQAHDKYTNDMSKMPKNFKDEYMKALDVIEGGTREFATTQKEMQVIQKNVSSRQGTIMMEEAQEYYKTVDDAYKKSVESANNYYQEKAKVFEEQLAQGRITEEEFSLLMQGVESKTSLMLAEASDSQRESLRILSENLDNRGAMLDIANGKEFERLTTRDEYNNLQSESDQAYLARWLTHTSETLKEQGEFSENAIKKHQSTLEDMLVGMGHTVEDAKKISKDLVDSALEEMGKGDETAKQAGKKKGDKHNEGTASTKEKNKKTAKDITDDINKELNKDASKAQKGGSDKGESHRKGVENSKGANRGAAAIVSGVVTSMLGQTTDGGGGKKASSLFNKGVSSGKGGARSSGKSVADSGKSGLSSVRTTSTGNDFVSGFRIAISNGIGPVGRAAWKLGKAALSSLKSAQKSASPSKETGKLGFDFGDGYINAIKDSRKEANQAANLLGEEAVDALSKSIDKQKQSIGSIGLAVKENQETLKVEHSLSEDFNRVVEQMNGYINTTEKSKSFYKDLLNATLKQTEVLIQLLEKDSNIYLDTDKTAKELAPKITKEQEIREKSVKRFR